MKVNASKEVGFVIASICRITEQLRLEGILKEIRFQPSCSGQGCQPLGAYIYIKNTQSTSGFKGCLTEGRIFSWVLRLMRAICKEN